VQQRFGGGVFGGGLPGDRRLAIPSGALALKLLKPFRGDDLMPRFRREMAALARCSIPISFLLDYGEIPGPCLSGDRNCCAGRAGAGASLERGVPLLLQLAQALAYAHKMGSAPRYQPANVVLREDGVVKLTDFGLARSADSST